METVNVMTDECYYCGQHSIIQNVPTRALMAWQSGAMYIQEAFPEWTAEQRELLKTGIHPECWDAMMSEEDDDE